MARESDDGPSLKSDLLSLGYESKKEKNKLDIFAVKAVA